MTLEADGGTPPYFFGALDPLPDGLNLFPSGEISGTPAVGGTHTFTIKAFDNGGPTLSGTKTFELSIGLAPLEIVSDQVTDLFVTKIFNLPLIVIIDGIPVPYSATLQAMGGQKPYTWSEVPLPAATAALIPDGGLPDGLTISADGVVSGAVTDPSLAITFTIPFTQIQLSGFFFSAQVQDSQDPPETTSALFSIPTIPP